MFELSEVQGGASKVVSFDVAVVYSRVEMGKQLMDFVFGLPRIAMGCDTIWVIVDRLTKSAHLLLMRLNCTLKKLVEMYIKKIVSLHCIPSSIVSDRDPKFTSRFWESLRKALGTNLRLSSAYHPQTNGKTDMTIQSLEDLLRICVLVKEGACDGFLSLVEFTYNNSFHFSIRAILFEALYGRRCTTSLCCYESG